LAQKKGKKRASEDAAAADRIQPSESTEMTEARERAITRCKKLKSQIIGFGRPTSVQMEESFKILCKMRPDESLTKYPELQAKVDEQKAFEDRVNEKLEEELAQMLKENNLTEEDLKDEYSTEEDRSFSDRATRSKRRTT
jgi:hypothetical protein